MKPDIASRMWPHEVSVCLHKDTITVGFLDALGEQFVVGERMDLTRAQEFLENVRIVVGALRIVRDQRNGVSDATSNPPGNV